MDATSLDLSSLATGAFTINLESLADSLPGNAANFDPTQNYSFVLVNAADGITGTFNPADFTVDGFANNGATGFSNSVNPYSDWSVTIQGNNLMLQYTAPEPSTYAMMLVGLALLGIFRSPETGLGPFAPRVRSTSPSDSARMAELNFAHPRSFNFRSKASVWSLTRRRRCRVSS